MVDPQEVRRRAHGRSKEEQRKADREEDPAETWGKDNPKARSGNPQNRRDGSRRSSSGH